MEASGDELRLPPLLLSLVSERLGVPGHLLESARLVSVMVDGLVGSNLGGAELVGDLERRIPYDRRLGSLLVELALLRRRVRELALDC